MFPRVCRVIVSVHSGIRPAYQNDYWSSLFAGQSFPDLCQLETNGFERDLAGLPPSIGDQLVSALEITEQSYHDPIHSIAIQGERLEYFPMRRLPNRPMTWCSSLSSGARAFWKDTRDRGWLATDADSK
jgi:hypothetical protein